MLNREFKNILSMLFSFLAMIALPCCHSILSILGSKDKPCYTESHVITMRAIARLHCIVQYSIIMHYNTMHWDPDENHCISDQVSSYLKICNVTIHCKKKKNNQQKSKYCNNNLSITWNVKNLMRED